MIVISPYARPLRDGKVSAKNYPYWKELIELIDEDIVQVGVEGEVQLVDDFRKNLSFDELKYLVHQCRTWVSVDSFFQHFCWDIGKSGIVLWGLSDPLIFGHYQNMNLLKDRAYLRKDKFHWWEHVPINNDAWLLPDQVIKFIYPKV